MAHPKNYDRVFTMTFASVYPHYFAKDLKKNRAQEELDTSLCIVWQRWDNTSQRRA
jgi:hypothetical protein